MKFIPRVLIASYFCAIAAHFAVAIEPGFTPLLDRDHLDGWRQSSDGFSVADGVLTTRQNSDIPNGTYWYVTQGFGDFILRLEFKVDDPKSNSGVFIRWPQPGWRSPVESYEVRIAGRTRPEPTGSIQGCQRPTQVPLRKVGDWNEMEITAIGQAYTVSLNGQVINQFTGNRSSTGYLGLQYFKRTGSSQFRNIRIEDLGGPKAVPLAPPAISAVQTDANQPRIEILKDQAPNAMEWALAPLDQTVPGNIRQNLTFLREDLLDEGAKKPGASPAAYTLGSQLCNTLLGILEERTQTQIRAGFRAVEANARTGITSEALEARRDYKMSWPQFARENAQRAELKSQAVNNAAVMAERPKVDWAARTVPLRKSLDALYAQFRNALRQPVK